MNFLLSRIKWTSRDQVFHKSLEASTHVFVKPRSSCFTNKINIFSQLLCWQTLEGSYALGKAAVCGETRVNISGYNVHTQLCSYHIIEYTSYTYYRSCTNLKGFCCSANVGNKTIIIPHSQPLKDITMDLIAQYCL